MRLVPWIAALCFLALVLSLPAEDAGRHPSSRTVGSSYEAGPHGLSLARAVLASRPGAVVESVVRPIGQARLPPDGVVFRVLGGDEPPGPLPPEPADAEPDDEPGSADDDPAPGKTPSASPAPERQDATDGSVPRRPPTLLGTAEERWISGGGRLVVATAVPLPEVKLRPTDARVARKHLPVLPTVRVLQPTSASGLGGPLLERGAVAFSRGGVPIAVRATLGRGELWVLSVPEVLENGGLAIADHLPLLVGLAGQHRPVFFDESVHGVQDAVGAAELLRRWGLGPSVGLVALALGLAFWRRRATLGPPAPWEDRRSESVDLLDSLSLLYLRALAPAQALVLHRQRLRHELQWRERLPPDRLEARLAEVLPRWSLNPDERLPPGELSHRLAQLNDALRRIRDPRHR